MVRVTKRNLKKLYFSPFGNIYKFDEKLRDYTIDLDSTLLEIKEAIKQGIKFVFVYETCR